MRWLRGVKRVRDENRIIHNGNVSLSAIKGSVVTTGPVGTVNPALQTLSPQGFDHTTEHGGHRQMEAARQNVL